MLSATGVADTSSSLTSCRRFTLAEIQSATNDFDDELVVGRGGFGKVYKSQISIEETGHGAAIKRLDCMSNQGASEFRAEIEMLSKLRHCNLVSLIGYCDENNEMVLVYEYMPNGTLYDHLHKVNATPLTWVQRLKMGIGAGRGLDYLHTGFGTKQGVIHRDVKSSNILLDENWEAMLSDFGLSKIGPINQSLSYVEASVKGTFGYLDPEYFYTRKLTVKTDVYAFGVVLFELLSGRLAVDERQEEEQCSLVRWAQKCVKEGKYDQIVDPAIRGTISSKCLRRFAEIANRCLLSVLEQRPTLTKVVAALQDLLEIQEKSDVSAESTGIMSLTRKIHKYLASTTKVAPGQTGIGSPANLENSNDDSHHDEMRATRVLRLFTFDELSCATSGFAEETCLRIGRYTKVYVYKGWVDKTTYSPSKDATGLPVAIKSMSPNYKWDERHVKIIKEFDHPNLVKLLGYCMKDELLFLVYEFMLGGNFQGLVGNGALSQIPLVTKVKIAVELARGLVFLNKTQHKCYISEHRLDRDKILLDEDYTVKLSGYDITKLLDGWYSFDDIPFGSDYYIPGCEPPLMKSCFDGFIVIFIEILTGKQFKTETEFDKFKDANMDSWRSIANVCYNECNELGIESKVLQILYQYKTNTPTMFIREDDNLEEINKKHRR